MAIERGPGRTLAPRTQLVLDVFLGLVARAVLTVSTSYRGLDADIFAGWAKTMHDHPLRVFYVFAPEPDHLPGDLWVLKALQVGFTAAGGHDFGSGAFELLTNAVPIVADVVVGLLIYRIVRLWCTDQGAARAARWYLLNPGVIVLAGAWGQWDSISIALLLAGYLLVLSPGRRWVLAAPLFAWAVLTKPQLGVPGLILLLWVVLRPDRTAQPAARLGVTRLVASAGGFVVLGLATAVAVLQPFGVGVLWTPDGGSTLAARAQYAADLHRFTTMGAANIWLVVDRSVIGPADDVARWGSVTPAAVGLALLVVLWGAVAVTTWRAFASSRRLESLMWAASAAAFASCLVLTRVHERYYFPVLVLLLLWAAVRGFDRAATVLFWTFSGLFVIDLAVPMGWTGHDDGLLHRPAALVVIGLLHVLYFLALLALPWRERGSSVVRAGALSAPNAARRTAPG